MSLPPAAVLDDDGRAVHAQHQPGVRRADGRLARRAPGAYADPAWRERVRDGVGAGPGRCRPVGTPTRSWSRPRIPSWSGAALTTSPPSAAPTRSTRCSTSRSTSPTSALRVGRARQRRRGRHRHAAARGRLHARALRRRRARRPAVRRPAGHRPPRQLGARAGRARRSEEAVHKLTEVPGRPLRLRRPWRARARGLAPTWSCSIPTRSRPGPCAGCATSRPTPSA